MVPGISSVKPVSPDAIAWLSALDPASVKHVVEQMQWKQGRSERLRGLPDISRRTARARQRFLLRRPANWRGQTDWLFYGVPVADIKAWSEIARTNLPGGYEKIKENFKNGLTVYAFKFVKPGEKTGMAFDGLVHVNGKWRIFPKPFLAAQ